jgi:hypothetical protein
LSRQLRRWQAVLLATAIVMVPILSCSQRSLVLVTVNAPQSYSNVSLVITATDLETTTFNKVSFTDGAYKVGVYLPSDASGPVPFKAEVVQDGCEIASGGPVMSPDVSSGATVSMAIDLTAITGPCVPVDGGVGSGGTGGGKGSGGSGTGGVTTGTGGAVGTGGVLGSGGVIGSGGRIGTGGVTGSGGVVGTGGLLGSGGHGGSATGGTIGSGGMIGTGGMLGSGGVGGTGGVVSTGGVIGTGGIVGTGGVVGSGGGGGKGGGASGGTIGSGGMVGSGGSTGCICPANQICQSGSTICVCSEDDATACSGVPCGTVTNICQQTVSCPNSCPAGYVCDTTVNACRKLIVNGCGGSVSTGTGLVAGTEAAQICPAN